MADVRVTNESRRTRDRVGVQFHPGDTHDLTVSKRERIALRAVRGFRVEDLDGSVEDNHPEPEPERATEENSDDDYDPSDHTVTQVLGDVEAGEVSAENALELELEGKARNTLIDQLRDKLNG